MQILIRHLVSWQAMEFKRQPWNGPGHGFVMAATRKQAIIIVAEALRERYGKRVWLVSPDAWPEDRPADQHTVIDLTDRPQQTATIKRDQPGRHRRQKKPDRPLQTSLADLGLDLGPPDYLW